MLRIQQNLSLARCPLRALFFVGCAGLLLAVRSALSVHRLLCRLQAIRRHVYSPSSLRLHWHVLLFYGALAAAMDPQFVPGSVCCLLPPAPVLVPPNPTVCTSGSSGSLLFPSGGLSACPSHVSSDDACSRRRELIPVKPSYSPTSESAGTSESGHSGRPSSDTGPLFPVLLSPPFPCSQSTPASLSSEVVESRRSPPTLRKEGGQEKTQTAARPRHPLASGSSAGVPSLPPASLFVLYTFPEELDGLLFDPTVLSPSRQPCCLPPPPSYSLSDPVGSPAVPGSPSVGTPHRDNISEATHLTLDDVSRFHSGQGDTPLLSSDIPPVSQRNCAGLRSETPPDVLDSTSSVNNNTKEEYPSRALPWSGTGDQPLQCSSVILLSRWTRYADAVAAFRSKEGVLPFHMKSSQHNARLGPPAAEKYVNNQSIRVKAAPQPCVSFCDPPVNPPSSTADHVNDLSAAGQLHRRHSCDARSNRYDEPIAPGTADSLSKPARPLGTIMQTLDRLCPAELILLASRLQTRLPAAVRAVLAEDYAKQGRNKVVNAIRWNPLPTRGLPPANVGENRGSLSTGDDQVTGSEAVQKDIAAVASLRMQQTMPTSDPLVSRDYLSPDLGIPVHAMAHGGLCLGHSSEQQSTLSGTGASSEHAISLGETSQQHREKLGQKLEDELVADAMQELERQLVHLQLRTEVSPSPLRPRSSLVSPVEPPSSFLSSCEPGGRFCRVVGGGGLYAAAEGASAHDVIEYPHSAATSAYACSVSSELLSGIPSATTTGTFCDATLPGRRGWSWRMRNRDNLLHGLSAGHPWHCEGGKPRGPGHGARAAPKSFSCTFRSRTAR